MLSKLIELIAKETGAQQADILVSTRLDSLVADSLEMANLVLELEAAFGVDIPDEEAQQLFTVGDVLRYAQAHPLIREAGATDVPRIIELGSQSIAEGPYKGILADKPEVTTSLAEKLLTMPNAKVLVGEMNGRISAVFAFILFDHYYSGEFVAGEMIWYVEPEARKSGMALELLWAAEKLAHDMGAKKMQLTAPTDQIAEIYGRLRGYRKVETAFQRSIECR